MSEENKLEFSTPQEMLLSSDTIEAKAEDVPKSFFTTAEEATKIAYTSFRAEIKKILDESTKRGVNELELPVTPVAKEAVETLRAELIELGYKVIISSKYSTKQKNELYQGQSGSETILTIRY